MTQLSPVAASILQSQYRVGSWRNEVLTRRVSRSGDAREIRRSNAAGSTGDRNPRPTKRLAHAITGLDVHA